MQFDLAFEPEPKGIKARLNNMLKVSRFFFQYGFIPYVIFLGKNTSLI